MTHKKKAHPGRPDANFTAPREVVRTIFHSSDIMHAPPEKAARIINQITHHERGYAG